MAKTTDADAPPSDQNEGGDASGKSREVSVEPMDLTQEPVFLTVDHSAKRNSVQFFKGPQAEKDAHEYAADRAARVERKVAVFGPQIACYEPPKKVQTGERAELAFAEPEPMQDWEEQPATEG